MMNVDKVGSMANSSITLIVPVLPVSNLTRAIDFYHRLGFTSKRYKDGHTHAFIHRDGHELHLTTLRLLTENQSPSGAYFYLTDGSAAALEAEFRTAGVPIAEPLAPREWKMNEFVVNDPDGNQLVFGEGM
jgi:catechol 2,3-dioxygenase-like lactoylglutathione lyase family enzyme